jgi:hypothetical protein
MIRVYRISRDGTRQEARCDGQRLREYLNNGWKLDEPEEVIARILKSWIKEGLSSDVKKRLPHS